MIAPSMTPPELTYFQRATSSLRASATIIGVFKRPAFRAMRSFNHSVKVDLGWWRSHSQARLDHRCPQSRISRFPDPLFAIDVAALSRGGRKAGIGCDLPPIVEVSEQAFRVKYRSELWAYSFDA